MKEYLEAGRIVRPHGVRGEVVVEPWADSPEFLLAIKRFWFDEGKTDAGFLSARPHKGRLLMKLKGIDTPEQAETLRGRVLYLHREDVQLPAGKYFLQDLVGLRAVDGETGQVYGTLAEVLPGVANDVYRITGAEGQEYLFPAVAHMIRRVDVAGGVIELLPIPGIFDDQGVDC